MEARFKVRLKAKATQQPDSEILILLEVSVNSRLGQSLLSVSHSLAQGFAGRSR